MASLPVAGAFAPLLNLPLPWEIISLILRKSCPVVLKSATLVSHAMKDEADRWLWAIVALCVSYNLSSRKSPQVLPLERVKHVHSIKLSFIADLSEGEFYSTSLFLKTMDLIIAPAIHITSLDINLALIKREAIDPSILIQFRSDFLSYFFHTPRPSLKSLGIHSDFIVMLSPLELHHFHALSTSHPNLESMGLGARLEESAAVESQSPPRFPSLGSVRLRESRQLLFLEGSPLGSIKIDIDHEPLAFSRIIRRLEAFSDTLNELTITWFSFTSYNLAIGATLSAELPKLGKLTLKLLRASAGSSNTLVIDPRIARFLGSSLISNKMRSRMPSLRVLEFDEVRIQDMEYLGHAVFYDPPPNLSMLRAKSTQNCGSRDIYTCYIVEKVIGEAGRRILLHTVQKTENKVVSGHFVFQNGSLTIAA
ncbi:hypothetical protein DL93DRAFT_2171673 [Clavulina sp. PMI_390]|nr:hypothetical protein DL93DRAFT_2171673 [Clavulina sp. PMI_390]